MSPARTFWVRWRRIVFYTTDYLITCHRASWWEAEHYFYMKRFK